MIIIAVASTTRSLLLDDEENNQQEDEATSSSTGDNSNIRTIIFGSGVATNGSGFGGGGRGSTKTGELGAVKRNSLFEFSGGVQGVARAVSGVLVEFDSGDTTAFVVGDSECVGRKVQERHEGVLEAFRCGVGSVFLVDGEDDTRIASRSGSGGSLSGGGLSCGLRGTSSSSGGRGRRITTRLLSA